MRVAESTEIFAPIRHVGCPSACATVADRIRATVWVRNGPPEAVRRIRRISSRRRPAIAWKTAECSLSTGRISAFPRRAAAVTNFPAITRSSLFARAIRFPCSAAAMTGRIEEIPDAAARTMSTFPAHAASRIPSSPKRRRVPRGNSFRRSAPFPPERQTTSGRKRRARPASARTFVPAHSAVARNRRGNREMTSSAFRPTEPVAPSTAIPRRLTRPPRRGTTTPRRGRGPGRPRGSRRPGRGSPRGRAVSSRCPLRPPRA